MASAQASCFAIKSKWPRLVKPALVLALLSLGLGTAAFAQDEGEGDESSSAAPGALPDIEAKTYDVAVVRHSRSGKVYLFNATEVLPVEGKILLLKNKGG